MTFNIKLATKTAFLLALATSFVASNGFCLTRTPTVKPSATNTTGPTSTPTTPATPTTPPPTPTSPPPPPTATPKVTVTPRVTVTISVTPSASPTSCSADDSGEEAALSVPGFVAYSSSASSENALSMSAAPVSAKGNKNDDYKACAKKCESEGYKGGDLDACKTGGCGCPVCKKDCCGNSNTGDANGNYISKCKDSCNKDTTYSTTQRDACIKGCEKACPKKKAND